MSHEIDKQLQHAERDRRGHHAKLKSAADGVTESEIPIVGDRCEPKGHECGNAEPKTELADLCPGHSVNPFVGNGSYSKPLFLARCSRKFRRGSDVTLCNGGALL